MESYINIPYYHIILINEPDNIFLISLIQNTLQRTFKFLKYFVLHII